jgi:hypothetical protein
MGAAARSYNLILPKKRTQFAEPQGVSRFGPAIKSKNETSAAATPEEKFWKRWSHD